MFYDPYQKETPQQRGQHQLGVTKTLLSFLAAASNSAPLKAMSLTVSYLEESFKMDPQNSAEQQERELHLKRADAAFKNCLYSLSSSEPILGKDAVRVIREIREPLDLIIAAVHKADHDTVAYHAELVSDLVQLAVNFTSERAQFLRKAA